MLSPDNLTRNKLTGREMHEIRSSPGVSAPIPKCRRSLRSDDTDESYSSNNKSSSFHKEGKRTRNTSNQSESEESLRDQIISYDTQMTESSESEEDKETRFVHRSQNRSRTISPERNVYSKLKKNTESSEIKQKSTSYTHVIILLIMIVIVFCALPQSKSKVQKQPKSNPTLLLSESIKSIQTTFRNQESDIWIDISSAINEVISRIPKTPSIILLFANETTTMDCLATKLARVSSAILHADDYLVFNPKDFGNDIGEIITILNKHSPEKKKVVIIRDILRINTEAIKALHNLCDRINPLVAEVIYILTMQTNNYQSPQKKLNFVENQIYGKLSKSIDQDILMALVTRITDGAIISVQPEPQLRYC